MTTLSLTSLFRIPQHMATFDVLSRSSCFLLSHPLSPTLHPPLVATSQHVVAPYKYRNYYQDEWVGMVEPHHVKVQAELRCESGSILKTFPLERPSHHPTRDLTLLSFAGSETEGAVMAAYGLPSAAAFSQGGEVECVGHAVVEEMVQRSNSTPSSEDTRVCVPGRIAGVIALRSEAQTFLYPLKPLVDGYCGGPVVSGGGEVVGMIEGERERELCSQSVIQSVGLLCHFATSHRF